MYWGSSVVVAQSGYNTFHELGLSGVPHVLVPGGDFGVDDQKRRAESRTDDDVRVVDCDPVSIAKAIEDATAAPPRQEWPSGDGTHGAAQIAARLTDIAVGES
jgi:predicted glycosyltransferase